MREILFRGKNKYVNEWEEGNLFVPAIGGNYYIVVQDALEHSICYEIDPATVGQYTGLQDKNGKRIFEGDIVLVSEHNHDVNGLYLVVWETANHCWGLERSVVYHHHHFTFSALNGFAVFSAVIGNIHDNPELLEVPHEN